MLDEQGREFRTISANTKIIDSKRGIALLTVTGCLDAATAPSLEATVHNITREGATRLVFDLSGLFYLSSSGIDCFSNALKAVKPRGGDIILTGLQDRVLSVLQMYGFDRAFHREAAAADGLMCFGSAGLATKIRFPMYIRCPSCSTPVTIEESGTMCCPSCRSTIDVDEEGTVKTSAVRIRKESKNQLPSVQVFGQLELA